jgi:hypothetical protein
MLDLANAVRLVLVSLVVALVFGPSEAGMLKESGVRGHADLCAVMSACRDVDMP